jgi:ATP/maltotriose-dependent transcriptional regulator MalT
MALLATKLYVPPTRPGVLSRSRLSEQLNIALLSPFILISAPAGYGKTTLVSTWVADCGEPIAWLSLDAGDNAPIPMDVPCHLLWSNRCFPISTLACRASQLRI